MNISEKYISELNSSFFFKEFTFSKNNFKAKQATGELELADNVVWLDDILIVSQIKERNIHKQKDKKTWFENKVKKKAVKQIKDTIEYFEKYNDIVIENEKGHSFNISEAKNIEPLKIIIYNPVENFEESLRFEKFYISKKVGYIHLFHIEDYLWICKYLITPYEIVEYLEFREKLYHKHSRLLNRFPEQYVLGHFLNTTDLEEIVPEYIESLTKLLNESEQFDISVIIDNFQEKIVKDLTKKDYYSIIKELAKLDRSDLIQFKKRYLMSLEKAKKQEFDIPYRMYSLKSRCGFVFIPLEYSMKDKWKQALENLTIAHKYDQKLDKCVGMLVYSHPTEKYFDIGWSYFEGKWEYDEDIENFLKKSFPFRPVSAKIAYRYKLRD